MAGIRDCWNWLKATYLAESREYQGSLLKLGKDGVPQGLVLGTTICLNDSTKWIKSYLKVFADDARIMNELKSNSETCRKTWMKSSSGQEITGKIQP